MRLQSPDSAADWLYDNTEGLGCLYRTAKDRETEIMAVDALFELMRLGAERADAGAHRGRIYA